MRIDLLDSLAVVGLDFAPVDSWRKRLGARLLAERVQNRKWNYAKAASKAKIDAGTIRRIEAGDNYEVVKLERYAHELGRPIESWLREVLAVPDDLIQKIEEWSREKPEGEAGVPTKKRRQASG